MAYILEVEMKMVIRKKNIIRIMGRDVVFLCSLFLFLLPLVFAADYCALGEAECSDGEDNDGDGTIDYWGFCSSGDCTSVKTADDCESSCSSDDYTSEDSDCYSPYDPYEGTEGVTAAPEYETGFWERFFDWIIFWS